MRLNIQGKKFVVTLLAFDSQGEMIKADFETHEKALQFAKNRGLKILKIEGRHVTA